MPATLGHIGLQYIVSKLLFRGPDPKWILAGCIMPDIPWIFRRALQPFDAIPAIDLKLYAIVQSSLLGSLLLCAALSGLSRRPVATFGLLAFGSTMHLVLDAMQEKWANGVLLFAPLDWTLLRFDLFWPVDNLSVGLWILGLFVIVWMYLTERGKPVNNMDHNWMKIVLALCFFAAYLLLPLTMMSTAERHNLHFASTARQLDDRVGAAFEIDRGSVVFGVAGPETSGWFGGPIQLLGYEAQVPARASLKGVFVKPDTLQLHEVHLHSNRPYRSYASYLGLGFIVLWWIVYVIRIKFVRGFLT